MNSATIPQSFYALKPANGWNPYCVRFSVGNASHCWVRFAPNLEHAISSAKQAILDEFGAFAQVSGLTVDSQQAQG